MKNSFKIFFIKGIPIKLHWTFSLLILWILFMQVIAREPVNSALLTIGELLAVFLCVLLHEIGHALAALHYNIPIREIQLLPIGGLTFFAKQPATPRQEIMVSIAGPLVNIIIALILIPFLPTGTAYWDMSEITGNLHIVTFFTFLFSINVILALINLLPILPMDGGKILKGMLGLILKPSTAFQITLSISRVLSTLMVIAGVVTGNLLFIIYGCFLLFTSSAEKHNYIISFLLKDEIVSDAISQDFKTLHVNATQEEILHTLCSGNDRYYILTDAEEFMGILDKETILSVLLDGRKEIVLKDIIIPDLQALSADSKLLDVWNRLPAKADLILPVIAENKKIIGVISRDNIIEFLLNQASAEHKKPFALALLFVLFSGITGYPVQTVRTLHDTPGIAWKYHHTTGYPVHAVRTLHDSPGIAWNYHPVSLCCLVKGSLDKHN